MIRNRSTLWGVGMAWCAMLANAAVSFAAVNIALVPVGNPGSANDPATGYGRVDYAYDIGKYDVTAGQYCEFLNAVAATGDPQNLYNPNMTSSLGGCGIMRTYNNPTGLFVYATFKNANFPVNFVSFWDACRFTNWLQNNQPTGPEGPGTTETGAYDLTVPDRIVNNTVTRSEDAIWVIPSEDEWYKAAYYDPDRGGEGGYWQFPTRSNNSPHNNLANAAKVPNGANYYISNFADPRNRLTAVGAFSASPGPYGTFDQGGDVSQWNDTAIGGRYRGIRGGDYEMGADFLRADCRMFSDPATSESFFLGFRVAQLPEPISASLLGLGAAGMLLRRRCGWERAAAATNRRSPEPACLSLLSLG